MIKKVGNIYVLFYVFYKLMNFVKVCLYREKIWMI